MVHKLMLPVHVIGIGAGGSRTVRHLVSERTHIAGPLHICDGDSVEEKNCKNQLYQPSHVGMRKVHALAEQVRAWSEGDVVPVLRPEYFTPGEPLSGVVFLCVDKMHVRKAIIDASIRGNRGVSLLIEARGDTENALMHFVDPNDEKQMQQWDRYWYPDDEAVNQGDCGGVPTVGPRVADITAYLAVQELVRRVSLSSLTVGQDCQFRIKLQTYAW